MRFVSLVALAVLLTACPKDPYGPALTTIKVFRQSLEIGDAVVKEVNNNALNKAWPVAKETAIKTADLAVAAIDALKQGKDKAACLAKYPDPNSDEHNACLQKYKTDVVLLVKKAVCLALTALGFIPEKYRAKFQLYLDLGKSFVCPTPTPAPSTPAVTPAPPAPRTP